MRRAWLMWAVVVVGCGDDGGAGPGDMSAACMVDVDCDDGVFCNGAESCDPTAPAAGANGCVSGTDPCSAGDCNEAESRCLTDCSMDPDADGDGVDAIECGGRDCDDSDDQRYPGNTELCDGAGVDEDCDQTTFGFRDQDMDGFGDASCCNGDTCGNDCDDTNGTAHPGEAESCDTFDNDCDGSIDEGTMDTYWPDLDGDDFGDASAEPVMACAPPLGTAPNDGDCDDTRATRNPSNSEECDLIPDNDCDPTTNPHDVDRDGHDDASCGGDDCNDAIATVYEGAPEVCDGYDSDCSGEDVDLAQPPGGLNSFEDQDGDGAAPIGASCSGGFTVGDCRDDNPVIYPGAPEHCNGGIDDDCDETTSDPADCAAPTVVDAFVLATPAAGVSVDRAGLVRIADLAVDGGGNVLVVGSYRSDALDVGAAPVFGGVDRPAATETAFVARYSSAGALNWFSSMTTGAEAQSGAFIRRVGDEVLAVVRTQEATSYDGVAIAGLGSQDFVYVALDATTGDVLRATPFGSSSRDSVFSAHIDDAGVLWAVLEKSLPSAAVRVGATTMPSAAGESLLRIGASGVWLDLFPLSGPGIVIPDPAGGARAAVTNRGDEELVLRSWDASGSEAAPIAIPLLDATSAVNSGAVRASGLQLSAADNDLELTIGGRRWPAPGGLGFWFTVDGTGTPVDPLVTTSSYEGMWQLGSLTVAYDATVASHFSVPTAGHTLVGVEGNVARWVYSLSGNDQGMSEDYAVAADGSDVVYTQSDDNAIAARPAPTVTIGSLVDAPALAYFVRLRP